MGVRREGRGPRSRRSGEQDERDPERHHRERGEADYQPQPMESSRQRAQMASECPISAYRRQPDRPSIGLRPVADHR
jgi:hypothetical protein